MSELINPISAKSYTNKDFQSIYVELLEAAKTLAKNWDPTISNESDPGVVLLKLNAIIADKNNYNIDKNILENYPETYTQEISARSQYKQMGYRMPWYVAATTDIVFKWIGESLVEGDHLTIPAHTMVMDKNEKYVFTLLEDVNIGKWGSNYTDNDSVPAIQGVINTLKLSGNSNITISNLDSKNRLYINDHYIAENGIYVTNTDEINGVCWKQVENVNLEPFGTKCYEFDIDPKRNCPYLQFSDSIRNLIGNGLTVKYIVTNGYQGNVAAKVIDSFYDQSSVDLYHSTGETTSISLNNDNFLIYNINESVNGKDPQNIEDAYKSFRKNICTFDTLVTLRDYINAIYKFGVDTNSLSNVIVTDRTNDIQSYYRIMDKDDGLLGYVEHFSNRSFISLKETSLSSTDDDQDIYISNSAEGFDKVSKSETTQETVFVREDTNINDLSAFDIKFYILKSGGLLNDISSFNKSFDIDNSKETLNSIKTYIQENKSVQHDIVDIKYDVPFMLQNIYPINIKLVPTFKLNQVAQEELIANIKYKLIQVLNSRNCEFGQEPSYDVIYNEIVSCDERIKVLILDDFKYTTFAVYLGHVDDDIRGDPEFKYIPISDYSTCSRLIVKNSNTCNYCSSAIAIEAANTATDILQKLQQAANKILSDEISSTNIDVKPTQKHIDGYRFIDSTNGRMYCWRSGSNELKLYSDRLLDIRKEVIAKNILSGVTPLFDHEDQIFDTTIDMNQVPEMSGEIDNIKTSLEVAPFGFNEQYHADKTTATYRLRANEILKFTAPSFISDRVYANYVKFELVLKNPVASGSDYSWADPEDAEELIKVHGYNGFYRKTNNNTYVPLYCKSYEPLSDFPRFKLLYHNAVNQGSGIIYSINNKDFDHDFSNLQNKTLADVISRMESPKINEFETYVYYKLDGNEYKVINSFYEGFKADMRAGNYTNPTLYRLKHYNLGYVGVDGSKLTQDDIDTGLYYRVIDGEFDQIISLEEAEASNIESTGNNVYKKDNVCTHYNIQKNDGFSSITGTAGNHRFEPVLPYSSNIYIKMLDLNGNLAGYKLVESSSLTDFNDTNLEALLIKAYKEVLTSEGKPIPATVIFRDVLSRIVLAKAAEYRWNSRTLGNYRVRYLDLPDSPAVRYKQPSAPPDYTDLTFYTKLEDGTYSQVDLATFESIDWVNEYYSYYKLNNDSGLLENTSEYAQWKNGSLSLYVKESSFKLPSNTEYELRDGDYITFFWRSVDEDDAPYTYRHYNHIYDESTGQKTIIKASFPLKASIRNSKFFDHSTLDPSGEIPYSGSPESDFQKISTKMYDEYDLSGSRQIDVRKLNSVKVDENENKYYYLISPNATEIDGKELFKLTFNYKKTWIDKFGNAYARYQRILQAGEYFSYLNSSQTLFEIVGEGTLIEYNIKLTSGETPATTKELSNGVLEITDIYRRGVDALKEGCVQVESREIINIIEQQIYSFVKDDVIQITLSTDNTPKYEAVENISEVTHYYDAETGNYVVKEDLSRYSDDKKQQLQEYPFKEIYVPTYPIFNSTIPTSLIGYNVTYSSSNSNNASNDLDLVYTSLPSIELSDSDYNWQVTAHLNLSCDASIAQKIEVSTNDNKSKQTIEILDHQFPYYDEDANAYATLADLNSGNPDLRLNETYDELYLLSSISLDKVGSDYIDVTYQDLLGERHNINVLTYQLNKDCINKENNWEVIDSGIMLRIAKQNNHVFPMIRTIEGLKLSSNHKYLLPIVIPEIFRYEENTVCIYKVEGGTDIPLTCICCNNADFQPGRHYIEINPGMVAIKLEVTINKWENISTEIQESANIIFEKLFKYNYRDIFGGDVSSDGSLELIPKYGVTTADIISKIQALDTKNKFKYNHIPSVDHLIKDPLDPISLFSVDHVYNKFSIARAEIDNSKPFDATFDIVNNK